jgi:hypothetical protein
MDHLEVLREKVKRLRAEIAVIHESNQQYRNAASNHNDAQVAHGQRHERLQAIQRQLSQLGELGRSARQVDRIDEKKKASLHLVKHARAS